MTISRLLMPRMCEPGGWVANPILGTRSKERAATANDPKLRFAPARGGETHWAASGRRSGSFADGSVTKPEPDNE